MPRPLLTMLSKQYRDTGAHYGDEDAVSVTQLIAPVQQQRLLERHDVYVEPLDNLWAAWGTLTHLMLEAGVAVPGNSEHTQQNFPAEDEDWSIAELKLVQDFDGVKLGGTIDLLEYECNEGFTGFHGKDYKVTSAYGVKKMMKGDLYKENPDYYWQAQLYALLAKRAGYAPLGSWQIVAICRDWNERMHGAHCGPVEVIDVPLLAEERVRNFLKQRLTVWKASAMAEDGGLPSCTDAETWSGRRCAKYCAAAPMCWQFHPERQLDIA